MHELLDKKIKIFFNDGEKVSWRIGILTFVDNNIFILDDKDIIPISKIVRAEVVQ